MSKRAQRQLEGAEDETAGTMSRVEGRVVNTQSQLHTRTKATVTRNVHRCHLELLFAHYRQAQGIHCHPQCLSFVHKHAHNLIRNINVSHSQPMFTGRKNLVCPMQSGQVQHRDVLQ
jgi:hypothetical protein